MNCENINSEIKSITTDVKNKKTTFKSSRDCTELKNDLNYACNNIFRKKMFTSKNYMGLHIKAELDCSKLLYQFNEACYDNANKPSER